MIKFFRRIRQRLIDEGNLKKYLIYATGEVLLVMIGILLALQVNNWNNEIESTKKELALLNELKRNLTANLKILESSIQMDIEGVNSSDIIERMLVNKLPYSDTLNQHMVRTGYNEKMNLVSSAFTTLRSIGLDMIRNDSIRESTINLFEVEYPGLIEQTYNLRLMQFQELVMPKVNKYYRVSDGRAIINNYEELLLDHEFLNMVSGVRDWKNWSIGLKAKSVEQTDKLIVLIDNELNK